MTQRLVVIPWEEYHTLKNKLIGGGNLDRVPQVKTKEDEEPLKDIIIPHKEEDRLPHVEPLKDIRIPHKEEDRLPLTLTLSDKTPPGLPATGWLNWK